MSDEPGHQHEQDEEQPQVEEEQAQIVEEEAQAEVNEEAAGEEQEVQQEEPQPEPEAEPAAEEEQHQPQEEEAVHVEENVGEGEPQPEEQPVEEQPQQDEEQQPVEEQQQQQGEPDENQQPEGGEGGDQQVSAEGQAEPTPEEQAAAQEEAERQQQEAAQLAAEAEAAASTTGETTEPYETEEKTNENNTEVEGGETATTSEEQPTDAPTEEQQELQPQEEEHPQPQEEQQPPQEEQPQEEQPPVEEAAPVEEEQQQPAHEAEAEAVEDHPAEPAVAAVVDPDLTELPPPDFGDLQGMDLLKAQRAYEHAQRLHAFALRNAKEEEEEKSQQIRVQEARHEELARFDQKLLEDEELIHSVEAPPRQDDLLFKARAEVEAIKELAADTFITQPPSLEEVEDEAVVVDQIQLEDIQAKEMEVEMARVEKLKSESAHFLRRLETLKQRDIETTKQSEQYYQDLLTDLETRRKLLGASSNQFQNEQEKAFKKAQTYLAATLETQKRLVTKEYGELEEVNPIYCDGRVREKQQASAPRLMTVKIDCLRAIKNKLPGGFYVVLITLYDRLGGHPLRWCQLPDGSGYNHYSMTSAPQRHGGKFYNLELSFAQEANLLTLACPSLRQARPNNVMIFELVAVRGGRHLTDRVIAWGAFPFMNTNKTLIRGRYKVPLLRGEMDTSIDKYSGLQDRLTTDIDYWLCNLYFEINPIPLRANYVWCGLKISSLQYKIDTQAIMKGNYYKVNTSIGMSESGGSYSYGNSAYNGPTMDELNAESGAINTGGGTARLSTPILNSGNKMEINPFLPAKYQKQHANPSRGSLASGKNNSTSGDDFILPSDMLEGGANEIARKLQQRERAKELRTYKHSITSPEADVPLNPGREKIRFLLGEITGDLTLSRIATLEFWSTIGLFILSWWLRIYVHYLGQYYWLKTSWLSNPDTDLYEFTIKGYTCTLKYLIDSSTPVTTQSLVLVMGVVSNQICLLGLLLLCWLTLRTLGSFSDAGFRFLLVYSINVLFDPISIIVVDALDRNWDGDYFKLYNVYSTSGGTIGYAGAFLTITLAAILICISFVILFVYLTKLHMDGRMLDVYHRLHSDEGDFFVPNDLELSVRTLRYVLGKSKKWTGFHGTRRKVLLTAYLIDDHLDRSFHDRTLHLSIYNVTPKSGKRPEQRDIFRHFVRSSDGAIIEAFEAAESLGADGYQKLEERWLSQEATTIDDQEAEAEDMLKHMLSDQKRADAEKTGHRGRSVKSLHNPSSGEGSEPSMSGMGGVGGGMSVVQELSQERSEADWSEHEDGQERPNTGTAANEAALEHIGEEAEQPDEAEYQEEEEQQ